LLEENKIFSLIAGAGFEPATFPQDF